MIVGVQHKGGGGEDDGGHEEDGDEVKFVGCEAVWMGRQVKG